MSTLNSSQLHLSRSSTRIHAPPGGGSSISFGGYDTSAPAPVKKVVEEVKPVPVVEVEQKVVEETAFVAPIAPSTTVSATSVDERVEEGESFSGLVYATDMMSEPMIEMLKAKGVTMTKMLDVDGSLVYKMSVMGVSEKKTTTTDQATVECVEPEVVMEKNVSAPVMKEKDTFSPKKIYAGGAGPSSVIFG